MFLNPNSVCVSMITTFGEVTEIASPDPVVVAVYVDRHEIDLWRNRSFDQKLINIFSGDHRAYEYGRIGPCVGVVFVECAALRNVRFVSIDEASSPAKIQGKISAVAVHAIPGTDIEKDAFQDTQSGDDEEDHAVFLKLRKTAEACLTEPRRATGFDLGTIMMPELELADFGCWRRSRVQARS